MKSFTLLIVTLIIFYALNVVEAKVQCIDINGEAVILNGDIFSAKAEAIARAKWNAVEQVAGVKVKAQTVVQNFTLIDDAVIKKTQGVITNYTVKKEWTDKEVLTVLLNVCVEPDKAEEALSNLASNNSLAVFIPVKKPKVMEESEEIYRSYYGKSEYHYLSTKNEIEEESILSETLIGALTERGITVVDIIANNLADAQIIENAMKSGNYVSLKSLMYKSLSNLLLIGKVDYVISTRKGQEIGYGLKMPFHNVTTRLTYRIVAKERDSNRVIVLTSGTEESKGFAINVEDATAQSLKNLSDKIVPVIFEKIRKYMRDIAKKVVVKVEGLSDVSKNFEVKAALQNIAWVTEVEEKGLGEFLVTYPENLVYLANSLNQKGFNVVNFTASSIIVKLKN